MDLSIVLCAAIVNSTAVFLTSFQLSYFALFSFYKDFFLTVASNLQFPNHSGLQASFGILHGHPTQTPVLASALCQLGENDNFILNIALGIKVAEEKGKLKETKTYEHTEALRNGRYRRRGKIKRVGWWGVTLKTVAVISSLDVSRQGL